MSTCILQDKIDIIKSWADREAPPTFDLSYVESLEEQLTNKGTLSDSQEAALDNIIEKWRIE